MISFNVHEPLFLHHELPWNSWAIGLETAGGAELTLYCRNAQEWYALRAVYPKAERGYWFHPSKTATHVQDHAEADRMAAEIFAALAVQVEAA